MLQVAHRLAPTFDRGDRRRGRRERRELRTQDRLSARLAELSLIDDLLGEATRIVEQGWLQHGWFTYVDAEGDRRVVVGCTPRITRRVTPDQVSSVCLVGSILFASGGPSQWHTQLVQRAADVTWHAGFRGSAEPIHWCPAPFVRASHLADLVRWNDSPGRMSSEVTSLLRRSQELTQHEVDRIRSR